MTAECEIAGVVPTQTFVLDGVQWLPHYRDKVYVSPGYSRQNTRTLTAEALKACGAIEHVEMLWPRGRLK